MKRVAPGLLALVFSFALTQPALADPITGDVAIAGSDTYSSTGITFINPGVVFSATGSLTPMMATPVDLNNIQFSSAPGMLLFSWSQNGVDVTMTILTLIVQQDTTQFLDFLGTGTLTETGQDPTLYDYSLSSTTTGTATSYALTLSPPSPIPEPGSLFLVGTGLLALGGLLSRKLKKPALLSQRRIEFS